MIPAQTLCEHSPGTINRMFTIRHEARFEAPAEKKRGRSVVTAPAPVDSSDSSRNAELSPASFGLSTVDVSPTVVRFRKAVIRNRPES